MVPEPEQEMIKQLVEELKLELKPRTNQPSCPICAAKLRFGVIGSYVFPQVYKNFVSAMSKYCAENLCKAQIAATSAQHNNYSEKISKPYKGYTNPQVVILELGYNPSHAKVHRNNIETMVMCKGNAKIIRLSKSEDALKLDYPDLEGFAAQAQVGQNFNPLEHLYPILTDNVCKTVAELFEMYSDRYLWQQEFDDPQYRTEKYLKKKNKQ